LWHDERIIRSAEGPIRAIFVCTETRYTLTD